MWQRKTAQEESDPDWKRFTAEPLLKLLLSPEECQSLHLFFLDDSDLE